MTRLLHVTTTPISLDWLLGPQLDAFVAAGYDVVTASAPGPHARAMEQRGITHHELSAFTRSVDFGSDVRAAAQCKSLLDEVQPDILHTHNPKPGVIGRIVGRWSRVPIVVNTVHGLYAQKADPLARRAAVYGLERLAAAHSDAELVQNIEDVETLCSLGVPKERVHLLGNGIDLDAFTPNRQRARAARCRRIQLGIPLTTPIVGMVGRLVWEKGYGEFFDAVKILRRQFNSTEIAFVVVGPTESGPNAVDAETRAFMTKEHGVHFLGEQHDVASILSMFDVFALPSHREGFPRAAMEASAMGMPVIATDIRGCRQVVDHGTTGLLVSAKKPHHLALAIERLTRMPVLRAEMGRAARRKAIEAFDQQRVIEITLDVYEQLLASKSMSAPVPNYPTEPEIPWYLDSIDLVERDASNRDADSPDATAIELRSA